jgi:hypothetical protein
MRCSILRWRRWGFPFVLTILEYPSYILFFFISIYISSTSAMTELLVYFLFVVGRPRFYEQRRGGEGSDEKRREEKREEKKGKGGTETPHDEPGLLNSHRAALKAG